MTRLFFIFMSLCSCLLAAEFYTPAEDLKRLKKQVVPHDESLPNVLLIGDSISIAYTPFVIDLLKGKANVYRIKGNGGSTVNKTKVAGWIKGRKWDLIHFNFGLHDLCYRHPESKVYGKRDKIKGTLSVTLEDYEKNLEEIVDTLKKTGAKLIWASTTLVPEGEAGRHVGDDVKYNKVAGMVMKDQGVSVNDLYALTTQFDKNLFVKPGDVHFTPEGSYKLAQQVKDSILSKL